MSSHEVLLQAMRSVLQDVGIAEMPAAGEFSLGVKKPTLYPGAVYGFATRLSPADRQSLFEEAQMRRLCQFADIEHFRPIEGDLYPIYWGKDKFLGTRPHQHLGDPKGTGVIRLSTYETLKDKTFACVSLTVADYVLAEKRLQQKFPDLLKTTKERFAR